MKKLISYAAVASVLLVLPTMAFAGGRTGKVKENNVLSGTVTAVDAIANTITVAADEKGGAPQNLPLRDAAVTIYGKASKLSDVTVGMHADVTIDVKAGEATAIAVMPPHGGHKKKNK